MVKKESIRDAVKEVRIEDIKLANRIRKDMGDLEELSKSIREQGLLQLPVVTPNMELIAGHRRVEACKQLGWESIEIIERSVDDQEKVLLEITENTDRKDFNFSERIDCARQLESIESVRAKERMAKGANGEGGKTRDIVAKKVGFGSGSNYANAKYVAEKADNEMIRRLDAGELTIHGAYNTLKKKENASIKEAGTKDNEDKKTDKPKIKKRIIKVNRDELARDEQEKAQLNDCEKDIAVTCEVENKKTDESVEAGLPSNKPKKNKLKMANGILHRVLPNGDLVPEIKAKMDEARQTLGKINKHMLSKKDNGALAIEEVQIAAEELHREIEIIGPRLKKWLEDGQWE